MDAFAASVLWLARVSGVTEQLDEMLAAKPQPVLDLASMFLDLKHEDIALLALKQFYLGRLRPELWDPLLCYWSDYLGRHVPALKATPLVPRLSNRSAEPGIFPSGRQTMRILTETARDNPKDGRAALYLGDVLFQAGRYAEARQEWQRAADLGASQALAYRALGMASLNLDHDAAAAAKHLALAHLADPTDAIVARDLAKVLFTKADEAASPNLKQQLWTEARDTLQGAFASGKSRSDYVCLLARAQNRLSDFSETAKLLDSVRITVWEGSHEAHDLFEEAHLALGRADLAAGRPAEALREFDRALEYPENLAIGKLEKAHEAHIYELRAQALSSLGNEEAARQARAKAASEQKATH